ncbi:MAG: zf-HC2 domain-containing protein [Acidobacteriota bacterium]
MKCVGFNLLIDFLDHRLEGRQSERVEKHLSSGCARCEADRQWYESFKAIGRSDHTIEPPPWVLRRAVRLFETEKPSAKLSGAARGVVRLIFDSFRQTAPAGVRQTGISPARQLVYSVWDYSIDLHIAMEGDKRATVVGQILNAAEPGFGSVAGITVETARRGKRVQATVTDEIGIFVIKKLSCGEYDFAIQAPNMTINLVSVPVSPSS